MNTGANTSSILQWQWPKWVLLPACPFYMMADIGDGPISVTVLRFKVGTHQGLALSPLLFLIVIKALSREIKVTLTQELLFADDLFVIAETEDDLIKRLNEWKDNVENRGMRVNMNKSKVMITEEWQKLMQKAVR